MLNKKCIEFKIGMGLQYLSEDIVKNCGYHIQKWQKQNRDVRTVLFGLSNLIAQPAGTSRVPSFPLRSVVFPKSTGETLIIARAPSSWHSLNFCFYLTLLFCHILLAFWLVGHSSEWVRKLKHISAISFLETQAVFWQYSKEMISAPFIPVCLIPVSLDLASSSVLGGTFLRLVRKSETNSMMLNRELAASELDTVS